jgi:ribonuclease D
VLQDKTLDKLGEELLAALALGEAAPLEGLVQRMDTRPSATEKAMAQRLAATLKSVAEDVRIAPEVLATQRELRALARAAVGPEATPGQEPAGLPCLRGWRRGVVGEALLEACRVD